MSLKIKSTIVIEWSVHDEVYGYSNRIELQGDEILNYIIQDKNKISFDSAKLLDKQTAEYNAWLELVKPKETATIEG